MFSGGYYLSMKKSGKIKGLINVLKIADKPHKYRGCALAFNQGVGGSNPPWLTSRKSSKIKGFRLFSFLEPDKK